MKENYLTLEMAKVIADGAAAKAKELGINIAISICDNHGNLKYFQRMDDSCYGTIRVSQLKAKTSASFPLSSNELAYRSAKMPTVPIGTIPDMLTLGGGLPLLDKGNQHIGAIGVSGATPEMDELCAQAGIDELAKTIYP